MELTLKLSTEESMTLSEAKELTEQSQLRNVTPAELAVDFIKEGLRRLRETPTEPAAPTHREPIVDRVR